VLRAAHGIAHSMARIRLGGTLVMVLPMESWTDSPDGSTAEWIIEVLQPAFKRWSIHCSVLSEQDEVFLAFDDCMIENTPMELSHRLKRFGAFPISFRLFALPSTTTVDENISLAKNRWLTYYASVIQRKIKLANTVNYFRLPEELERKIESSLLHVVETLQSKMTKKHAPKPLEEWEKVESSARSSLRLRDHDEGRQCTIQRALENQSVGGGWTTGAAAYRLRTGGKLGVMMLWGDTAEDEEESENEVKGNASGPSRTRSSNYRSDLIVLEDGEEEFCPEPEMWRYLPRPLAVDIVYYKDTKMIAILDVWLTKDHKDVCNLRIEERLRIRDEIRVNSSRFSSCKRTWPRAWLSATSLKKHGEDELLCVNQDDDLYLNTAVSNKCEPIDRGSSSWRIWSSGSWLTSSSRKTVPKS